MHVVVVTDFAGGLGGADRVAVESALALAEAGVSVTFIHAIAGADERLTHSAIELICLGLTDIWNLRSVEALRAGIWNRRTAALLAPLLHPLQGAPDTVLHIHQWTRALSPALFPVLEAAKLPVFATVHDYFLACPNGVFYRFDIEQPCSLTPMSFGCLATNCDTKSYLHKGVRALRVATARRQLREVSLDLIHVSDLGRDRLTPFVPASWRQHRIDNPVTVAKESRVEIGSQAKFAFVGRLTREKGVLLAAAAAARAAVPIMFIGDGPAADEIRTLCPQAEITGWIPPDRVLDLLRSRVRAILAPSLWPETGPLTVYEAAAIGLPVVVSNRCGAAERVSTASGFVVEPTVEAFAEAMLRLNDSDLAISQGHAAYDLYWADPPTPQAHARKLLDLYDSACASARDTSG
jgi:glycosyltransferase involved in cell wall biosynthesis